MIEKKIEQYIGQVISQKFDGIDVELNLGIPPKKNMGDFALACFSLAKILKKSPQMIAEEISKALNTGNKDLIENTMVDRGYINIFVSGDVVSSQLETFISKGLFHDTQGNSDKTIIIDYIGANVGKPLHIGHMCTPAQGQVIINLYKKLGYSVISDSHICDWGTIFGKLIVAYNKYGDKKSLEINAVEHLFEIYVKISKDAYLDIGLEEKFRESFKRLSGGQDDLVKLWKKITDSSIDSMNKTLSRIFVKPDYDIGESFYEGLELPKLQDYPDLSDNMSEIVQELVTKGIAVKNDDNSVGVVFPEETNMPSCILQKRDGTHGYLASDLACIKYRMQNWLPSKIVYFVDVRQKLHFEQAFHIAKAAGWLKEDTEIFHAYNGFISLKDGAMSTRKGKIIKLDLLFDEAIERSKKIIQEKRQDLDQESIDKLSEIVGIGAIKYGYLKKSRTSDIIFDWDEFLSFEGNSGPYIQYNYVRANKILINSNFDISKNTKIIIKHEEEKRLAFEIMKFEGVMKQVSESYYPHVLCQYAYDLTKSFASFYNNVPILSEENIEMQESRLYITQAFITNMQECFDILGIILPEEM